MHNIEKLGLQVFAVPDNMTGQAQIQVRAREIDFVTSFGKNMQALLDILGIVRKYMKENKLERPEIFTSVSGKEDTRERKLDAQHNEEKEKKKDSKLVSYEMFCQGMTIEEIAKTRDLVTGTIAAHLEHYLREDKIKLEQVVTADKIQKVRTYLETHEFMGVVAIKAALGDEVSYADIRFVLATAGH